MILHQLPPEKLLTGMPLKGLRRKDAAMENQCWYKKQSLSCSRKEGCTILQLTVPGMATEDAMSCDTMMNVVDSWLNSQSLPNG